MQLHVKLRDLRTNDRISVKCHDPLSATPGNAAHAFWRPNARQVGKMSAARARTMLDAGRHSGMPVGA